MTNCHRCDSPLPDNSRYCQACGATVEDLETSDHDADPNRDPELEERLSAELAGEYAIERLIGRGGMAAVYLAREVELNRLVALKVLPPELAYGPGMVERFRREARTAATLDHPHIVPIFRTSTGGRLVWFAMKYIEGESLAEVLQREKSLAPERIAGILTQIGEALDFAHQHGVIHRDIKPENVMIDSRGWVVVTDFGIAKARNMQPLTGSGAMIGTPFYMSPEQCSGKQSITGASDQYSLGVMAYQMLTGRLPFSGESTVDIIWQHCFGQPLPLDTVRPGLPPGLGRVVECALAKDPSNRFHSITDFANTFSAVLHGQAPTLPLQSTVGRRGLRRRRVIFWAVFGPVAAGTAIFLRLWSPEPHRPSAVEFENTMLTRQLQEMLMRQPKSVGITPRSFTMRVGESHRFIATVYDTASNVLNPPPDCCEWRSSDDKVADVEPVFMTVGPNSDRATVTAVRPGATTIEARLGKLSGHARLRVIVGEPPNPRAEVPRTTP